MLASPTAGAGTNIKRLSASAAKTVVEKYSGTVTSILVTGATIGSEKYVSFNLFRCPCRDSYNENQSMIQDLLKDSPIGGELYSLVFIFVPAFALFLIGCAINRKTWKITTGCLQRKKLVKGGRVSVCNTLLEIFVQALLAPVAWMGIALLDGKYLACALTKKPYNIDCETLTKQGFLGNIFSLEFEINKDRSQVLGWIFIGMALFLGSLTYVMYRCTSPLAYHQRRYMLWYQDLERKKFKENALEKLGKRALENVKKFSEQLNNKKKDQDLWDDISTVFTSKRGAAKYSALEEANQSSDENTSEEKKSLLISSRNAALKEVGCNSNKLVDEELRTSYHKTWNTI